MTAVINEKEKTGAFSESHDYMKIGSKIEFDEDAEILLRQGTTARFE